MKNKSVNNKITDEEIRRLVIERLKTFPSGKKISIGSEGDFTKEQLIAAVERQDEIGKKIVEIQLEFLRSLKEGVFFDDHVSTNYSPQP